MEGRHFLHFSPYVFTFHEPDRTPHSYWPHLEGQLSASQPSSLSAASPSPESVSTTSTKPQESLKSAKTKYDTWSQAEQQLLVQLWAENHECRWIEFSHWVQQNSGAMQEKKASTWSTNTRKPRSGTANKLGVAKEIPPLMTKSMLSWGAKTL